MNMNTFIMNIEINNITNDRILNHIKSGHLFKYIFLIHLAVLKTYHIPFPYQRTIPA